MKLELSDIVIIKKCFPKKIILQTAPNKYTINFLTSILTNKDFQDFRDEMIEEYRILSVDKIDFKDFKDCYHPNLKEIYKWSEGDIKGYLCGCTLPYVKPFYFFLLIFFNTFVEIPNSPKIKYCDTPDKISKTININREEEYQNIGAIVLYHETTQRELILWIKKNWKKIEKSMDQWLPVSPLNKDKIKNLQIMEEISKLRENGKTMDEISGILTDKYPENNSVKGTEWVNTNLIRYQTRIDKYKDKYKDIDPLE